MRLHEFDISNLLNWSGDEMEKQYVPFVSRFLSSRMEKDIAKMLVKKFPDIKPVDVKRAIKIAKEKKAFGKIREKKWSNKYKRSINCDNPKGFSQKAHCAGRKK